MGCNDQEISILITDDTRVQELNRTYRNMDRPTNVLSFPMQEGEFADLTPGLLGDVVISLETAEKEAVDMGISLSERMSQLLIHGILHLIGFDHSRGGDDEAEMTRKSMELLSILEPGKPLSYF